MAKINTGIPFIDKLFSRNLTAKPGAGNGNFTPTIFGGPAVYPDPNALNYVQQIFSGNASIYTIISTAARKFGYIPRYTYQVADKVALKSFRHLAKVNPKEYRKLISYQKKAYDETIILNDEFDKLLKNPNEIQGQDAFFELIYVFYMLMGEAYIWLNRGDTSGMDDAQIDEVKPIEMYVLPAQYVEVVPDPRDIWGIVGYYFNVNGVRTPIRKNDVIRWVRPNPNFGGYYREHLRGISPLQAGNKLTTQDDSAMDAAVAMQQNDGAKGVLYNSDLANLDPVQKSQLESVINRKVNNRDIKGAVATLQGTWQYLDMGMSSVDMNLTESQEKVFIRLCNLFGVPPELFITQNTYDNKDQARRDLITGLILPDACKLRDEMNRVLLPIFYPDIVTRQKFTHDIDITDLPELQEDMAKKVTQLSAAWWLTPNQKLSQMGEEPSAEPNMDKIWIPSNLVMMDDELNNNNLDSYTGAGQADSGDGLSDPTEGLPDPTKG